MKKVSLFITLFLAVACCNSQDRPHPSMEDHLKRSQEMLQKELQMNTDQQKKVEQAFKDFMVEAENLHKENPPPSPPPMDPKMKAALDKLEQERDAKVKMALTAEQYKKYLEVAKKMRPPHPGMPKENPPS
jgi:hypothetical protein